MRPLRPSALAVGACLWAALVSARAEATSVATEVTGGNSHLGLNLFGDVDLRPDSTILTLCYSATRPAPELRVGHLFCGGVDQVLSDHWLLSASSSFSPNNAEAVALTPTLRFRSVRSSVGAQVALAYDSAGDGFLEASGDGGASATAYRLYREIVRPDGVDKAPAALVVVRPSLGAAVRLGDRVELGLRGTYFWYSSDPVRTGRFTDAQLSAIYQRIYAEAVRSGIPPERIARLLEAPDGLNDRLLNADAVSGLSSAPVWFELRPSLSYRFSRVLKAQLTWAIDRYVPGQGWANVLSTKWTVRPHERFRFWVAAALQADVLSDHPGADDRVVTGLGTVGAEYTF